MSEPDPQTDEFGPIQAIGRYGMLACFAAVIAFLVVAGAYTFSTGDALRLPALEIGIAWVAALLIFELMAFGRFLFWPFLAVAVFSAAIGAIVEVLAA